MNNQVNQFQSALISAVSAERRVTPNVERFVLTEVDKDPSNNGLRVRLRPFGMSDDDMPAMVDERFRMSHARWIAGNGETCQCEARIDETEDDAIYLDWIHPKALEGVEWLELECFDFLFATEKAWSQDHVAEAAYHSYRVLSQPERFEPIDLTQLHVTNRLSESQLGATSLVGFNHGWLFGPPGTGKTQTLAVLLAAYRIAKPTARILVVGISNAPLCELVERYDAILEAAGRNDLRSSTRRYGPGVSAEIRARAPHLLPQVGDVFMPGLANSQEVMQWRRDAEVKPQALTEPPHLLAMTVAMAIQRRAALDELGKFDLLVLEEASQASLAQTLLISSLAKATLYAGDPRQLSPVAKSADPMVRHWMARSPMMCMPEESHSAIVQLLEQRRMAPDICYVVAAVGYNGKLFTDEACLVDSKWIHEHFVHVGDWGKNQSIAVRQVPEEHRSKRLIRDSSANAIIEILKLERSSHLRDSDFLVLCPFRAQVAWIRHKLREANIRNVRVATVHRVQGKESSVVIFDPVCGVHPFLQTDEARRLMTVAFSRAKAKLIVVGSQSDMQNPLLAPVYEASLKYRARGEQSSNSIQTH